MINSRCFAAWLIDRGAESVREETDDLRRITGIDPRRRDAHVVLPVTDHEGLPLRMPCHSQERSAAAAIFEKDSTRERFRLHHRAIVPAATTAVEGRRDVPAGTAASGGEAFGDPLALAAARGARHRGGKRCERVWRLGIDRELGQ